MKKVKILSMIMASVMIFSACSSSGGEGKKNNSKNVSTGEVIKGAFVGKNITPEQANLGYESSISILKDGKIVYYTTMLEEKVTSADMGKTWTRENTGLKSEDADEYGTHYVGKISADDVTYYWLEARRGKEPSDDKSEWQLNKIDENGEKSIVNLPEIETIKQSYKDFEAEVHYVEGGKLWVTGTYNNQYEEFDGEKSFIGDFKSYSAIYDAQSFEKLYDLPQEITDESYYYGIESDGEFIYVLKEEYDYGEKGGETTGIKVKVYKLKDGSHVKDIEVDIGDENLSNGKTFNVTGGKLYFANEKGIMNIDKESGKLTHVLNGERLAFANPTYYANKFFALPNDEFVVMFNTSGKQEIWHFYYDEEFTIDPNAKITVLSLYEDWDVKYMAAKFQEEHPEATVKVEYMIDTNKSEYSVQNIQDAIKEINTRLLTGNAPDVLILDGLPAERYADQGILLNLDGKVDTSGAYPNLIEQVKVKNSLYYIPLGAGIPVVNGEQDDLDAIDTFDKFKSEIEKSAVYNTWDIYPDKEEDPEEYKEPEIKQKGYLFIAYNFQNIYDFFWRANESAIIENNKINEDNLRKFLEICKVSAEKSACFDQRMYDAYSGAAGEGYVYDPDEYEKYDILGRYSYSEISSSEYYGGFSKIKISEIGDYYGFSETLINEYFNQLEGAPKRETKMMNFPAINEGVWYPKEIISVTAETQNEELAIAFVNKALSKPVQKELGTGAPITKGAIEERFYDRDKDMYESEFKGKLDVDPIYESLKTPLITDNIVRTMAWQGAIAYCKGTISLDEAVSQIKAATNIYISERAQ